MSPKGEAREPKGAAAPSPLPVRTRDGDDTPRRITPKARRTREKIYATAMALFAERGFDGTSMRDIARAAGISLGSAYYYYESKDTLVFDFYLRTHAEARERHSETLALTRSFSERLRDVVAYKLGQLGEARPFAVALARVGTDPTHALSPFSPGTAEIRDDAIAMMEELVEGSDLKVHASLRRRLPHALWLYQMGLVFFWLHDPTPGQARTQRVLDASLALLTTLLSLSATPIPGMGKAVERAAQLLDDLELRATRDLELEESSLS